MEYDPKTERITLQQHSEAEAALVALAAYRNGFKKFSKTEHQLVTDLEDTLETLESTGATADIGFQFELTPDQTCTIVAGAVRASRPWRVARSRGTLPAEIAESVQAIAGVASVGYDQSKE